MINIGIIGLGGISRSLHIPQIRDCGRFYIKAAADIMPSDQKARELDIPEYYTDYRKILQDPEIDAVLIATPHDCHEEHSIAAFEAGKHVIIEKPISRNLKEAGNILDAAGKAGTVGMLGFCERFDPIHAYIKERLDRNELGQLLSARIDHYQNFHPAPGSWWMDEDKVGGGAVIGSGVHRLDLLRWYFGEAVLVYAKAVRMPERLEAEACAHAVIEFESGVIANFSINWAIHDYLYCEGFSVSGKNGTIYTTGYVNKISLSQTDNGALKDFTPPPCQTMYEHFAECIEKNVQPLTNMEEGYKSLQLVRAVYQSIKTGLPVKPQDAEL